MIEIRNLPMPVIGKPTIPKSTIPNWVWALFAILIACLIIKELGVFEKVFNKKTEQEKK